MSTMPPLIANWPASYTKSTLSKSKSYKNSLMVSIDIFSAKFISSVFAASTCWSTTFSAIASG